MAADWQEAHDGKYFSLKSQTRSNVTTDDQSESLSYCEAQSGDPEEGLLMWGTLSADMTYLSFTISSGPRQRSYSQNQSQNYFMTGGLPPITLSWNQSL
jgi:hypothetical protein